jgi:hypothetical protein
MCQDFCRNVFQSFLLAQAEEHQVLGGVRIQAAREQGLSNPEKKISSFPCFFYNKIKAHI